MAAQVDEMIPKLNCQENLHSNVLPALYPHLDEATLEKAITMEMEKMRSVYDAEEASYVQEQLKLNPIVEQRRPSQPGADAKRAEACRRSRYNGKVKKASLRFRHQFIAQKLRQSAPMLQKMRDVVANLETTLLADPRFCIDRNYLKKLKSHFGMDKFQHDLTTIIKMENECL